MKDLFPNKKFKFETINGVQYISKDGHELLLKEAISDFKKKLKEKLKNIDFWEEKNIWIAIERDIEKTAQELRNE